MNYERPFYCKRLSVEAVNQSVGITFHYFSLGSLLLTTHCNKTWSGTHIDYFITAPKIFIEQFATPWGMTMYVVFCALFKLIC